MVRTALEQAGGADCLLAQSKENPKAFMSLVGRLLPTQVTGKDDAPLLPEHAADPARLAQALLLAFQTLPRPEASGDREELPENR